ncbi:TIGR03619 family F420-dependent LLM class oxidoreductase [Allosaccharopolyspora coralli]|uniref:TIGR03619 family F420-dependent LLM class oxidoreductase n=1 Tax=Allosaccharopolyspora coralli TaxID=2665642 RepID=A0A5Q3Q822_9PSEU|nr:TIGR03619 family F420-dependent LLM class oxidoreductase [Allosaccharopolyspora coralli]QGK70632.1 TIGR03619 family F420-dependent LLM class oxidoreductase [Allosaccharopolyspora coralli]
MRLGLALPQLGHFADPSLIGTVAAEAERMGYESLWVGERLHAPLDPLTPYPGGGGMPELFRASIDPVLALTLAASHTSRALLGSSTLNAPLYSPMQLARSFAGIDQLSGGRLLVGLGLGWCRDEYDAAGVPWHERGARLDETLDVLETLWSQDPVKFEGKFWTISPGTFQPKPVQHPPPVYLGGVSPAAFRRIGRRADGWLGVPMPVEMLRAVLGDIAEHARAADRDPAAVRSVIRVNAELTDHAGEGGGPHRGTVEEIGEYLRGLAALGIADAFVDLQFTTSTPEELLDAAQRIRAACA